MTWNHNKLRKMWFDFFTEKEHYILPSESLVPIEDPSLLWINSGVATLKPYFEGKATPPSNRLVNSQKAIRTNDIENVGLTARHHTFFEMLGNFSIGDYFKKEAILFAWEFLTSEKWLNLSKEKLYITVFFEDEETYKIWTQDIKVKPEMIIKGTKETNFWDMGQGPCGPNTEIYYDRGEKYDSEKQGIKLLKEDLENDRYIEIWNVVFSQFNNDGNNNYTDLPRRNIDTGAGLERILSILEDVPTNYDTDLFQEIIHKIEYFTSARYDIQSYFKKDKKQIDINSAFKIISDHIRCLTFAISDGVFPSNKERGYILRRLLRRAAIYGQKLGINKPFLHLLVEPVIEEMKEYYRELIEKSKFIFDVIKNEEEKFWQTLESGKKLLLEIIEKDELVSGQNAFKLFDTFGYPIELTTEIATEHKVNIDLDGFNRLYEKHKEESRKSHRKIQALSEQGKIFTNFQWKSEFIGYEKEMNEQAKVLLLFQQDEPLSKISDNECFLVLDKTPFYAEKGGQAPDTGIISGPTFEAKVLDVQEGPEKTNIHFVKVTGEIFIDSIVKAEINHEKRRYTKKNHSGTHLLHSALREVLGHHVMQSGSFNNENYLRLDFGHFKMPTPEEIMKIETKVAKWIDEAHQCEVLYLEHSKAIEMGALAFFGEKYHQIVRVVKFGEFSIELCGGTHCLNTKEVEELLITHIESKGQGLFRVHAITSTNTIKEFLKNKILELKTELSKLTAKYEIFKIKNELVELKIRKINNLSISKSSWILGKQDLQIVQDEIKKLENDFLIEQNIALSKEYLNLKPTKLENGISTLITEFNNLSNDVLKIIAERYRQKYKDLVIIFLNVISEKETIILVSIGQNLLGKELNANKILKAILVYYNGKGGGSNILSQGKIQIITTPEAVNKILLEQL